MKLAKFKGNFVMHKHENEDELFYVVEGKLFIELYDHTLELIKGDLVIISRGVEHSPYALQESKVLLFEPKSTINTGDTCNEMTVSKPDKI